jgi:pyridoxamine 5'-phosphate oxidase
MTWTPFDVADAHEDPMVQFTRWYDEGAAVMDQPEAIVLATANKDARPSARVVLLRVIDERGFGIFTNYESQKGHELQENPFAQLLWYCEPLGRQIRVSCATAPMRADESDAYFAGRPRGHQLGAHASQQSALIDSREQLEAQVREVDERFAGRAVPRPAHWGGVRCTPERFEFWQQRTDRLHDRVIYEWRSGHWIRERRQP